MKKVKNKKPVQDATEFINIDNFLEVDDSRKNNYPYPQYPLRMLIVGPSGCGKTNMMINMIQNMVFDNFILFTRDIEEPKYLFLKDYIEKMKEDKLNAWYHYCNEMSPMEKIKMAEMLNCDVGDLPNNPPIPFKINRYFSEEPNEIPDPNDFVKEYRLIFKKLKPGQLPTPKDLDKIKLEYPITLIVFDDLITLKDKKKITELYIRGRKRGVNPIFISQSVTPVDKDIRLQCTDICLYKCKKKDLVNLCQNFGGDLDNDEFYRAFKNATKRSYNFFYINDKSPKRSLAFRKNFTPGSLFVDDESDTDSE